MRTALLAALIGAIGCSGGGVDSGAPRSCAGVLNDIAESLAELQRCDAATDCGLVLTGTSCGCTRNLVARADADTTRFYALLDEAYGLGCDPGFTSTCDCPEVDGYACAAATCTWNYLR